MIESLVDRLATLKMAPGHRISGSPSHRLETSVRHRRYDFEGS